MVVSSLASRTIECPGQIGIVSGAPVQIVDVQPSKTINWSALPPADNESLQHGGKEADDKYLKHDWRGTDLRHDWEPSDAYEDGLPQANILAALISNCTEVSLISNCTEVPVSTCQGQYKTNQHLLLQSGRIAQCPALSADSQPQQ